MRVVYLVLVHLYFSKGETRVIYSYEREREGGEGMGREREQTTNVLTGRKKV